ncbi:MAG: sodium/proline symporter [Bacteroidota bacterium]
MNSTIFENIGAFLPLTIVFLGYTAIIYGLAILAKKRTQKVADYVLGGRHMGGFVTALSAGASDMSSWLLMALPGMVMTEGVGVVWLPLSLTLGSYLNWWVVAGRLRVESERRGDALTIPAYLAHRFGGYHAGLHLLSSAIIIFFSIFYAVAGFVSAGKLGQLLLGVDYLYALWGLGFFIVAYTAIGGFLAVSWVDVFQGILMFASLLVVPWVVYGQLGNVSEGVKALDHNGYWDIKAGVSWVGLLSLFAWGLGYMGQPHIIGRFMAIRSPEELPLARRICTFWMGMAMAFAFAVGLVGAIYYRTAPLEDPEMVFLQLSKDFFNDWCYGILVCAVLSSIMSTVSCLILMAANAVVEDLYRVVYKKKKVSLSWHRMTVLGVSLVALMIASAPQQTIMASVAFPWCGLGASFSPVIVMSLYWKRLTPKGAMAGMVTGGGFVVGWEVLRWMGLEMLQDITGLSLLPACMLSLVVMTIVSRD